MEKKVYELLKKLGIEYNIVEHPALFSGKDNKKYNIKFNSVVCKNLFITNNKKNQYYLFILPLEKKINLKLAQEELKESRLSFGDEKTLEEKLKIKSGSVSVFNIINVEKTDIIFVIDKEILTYKKVGFHPNINTLTVEFDPKELPKILEKFNVNYKFIEM